MNPEDLLGAIFGRPERTAEQIAEARQVAARRCRRMAELIDLGAPLPIVRREAELIARSLVDLGIVTDADLGGSGPAPRPALRLMQRPGEEPWARVPRVMHGGGHFPDCRCPDCDPDHYVDERLTSEAIAEAEAGAIEDDARYGDAGDENTILAAGRDGW